MVVGEASDGRKGLFLGQDGALSHLESGNLALTTGAAQQRFSSEGKRELQSSKVIYLPGVYLGKPHGKVDGKRYKSGGGRIVRI